MRGVSATSELGVEHVRKPTRGASRRLKIAKWLVAAPISAAVVVWLTGQSIPSWYRPPVVSEAELAQIRASLPQTYQDFTDQLIVNRPFTFEIEAATINRWIAARSAIWPDAGQALPEWIDAPAVAFDAGLIRLGGTLQKGEWKAISSLHLNISIRDDELRVRPVAMRIGALPIPRSWIRRLLPTDIRMPDSVTDISTSMPPDASVHDILGGLDIRNRFFWQNGRRHFRLTDIQAANGRLTLTVEPLWSD